MQTPDSRGEAGASLLWLASAVRDGARGALILSDLRKMSEATEALAAQLRIGIGLPLIQGKKWICSILSFGWKVRLASAFPLTLAKVGRANEGR